MRRIPTTIQTSIAMTLLGSALLPGLPYAAAQVAGAAAPTCEGLAATIVGTDQVDVIDGTDGDDVVVALGGGDFVDGRRGSDVICGGGGGDQLRGNGGADVVNGGGSGIGPDGDELAGGLGPDVLRACGDPGAGRCAGVGDELVGDEGRDRLVGGTSGDALLGRSGADRLVGAGGEDFLQGGSGPDRMAAGGGDDTVFATEDPAGALATDTVLGGDGVDLLSYQFAGPGLVVDLALGTATATLEADTLADVEDVEGTTLADTLRGDAAGNELVGFGGDDELVGRAGVDVARGGRGTDSCAAETALRCES